MALLDPRWPQRLLLPRCRICGVYTLSWAHKAILIGMTILYLLIQTIFTIREGR